MQCFHCKEYDHIKRDYLEHVDGKKGDTPSTTLAEEYIGDVLIVSKDMNTFSHGKWILDSDYPIHICSMKEYFDTF